MGSCNLIIDVKFELHIENEHTMMLYIVNIYGYKMYMQHYIKVEKNCLIMRRKKFLTLNN